MTATQTKASMLLESASRAVELSRGWGSGAETLSSNRLLGRLSTEDLDQLTDRGRSVGFEAGAVVSQQGAAVDAVLFIEEGRAKAEAASSERPAYRAVVNLLGPGDDVGLLSLVDGGPHPASIIAMEPVKCLVVPMKVMNDYLGAHPEWHRSLAEIAVSRLRASDEWLEALI